MKLNKFILISLFLTGAGALGLELIIYRLFSLIIGADALSISFTVSSLLGSLSLGYWLWGLWLRKSPSAKTVLFVYSIIEISLGVFGLILALSFSKIELILEAFSSYSTLILFSFFTITAPMGILMAASFPLLFYLPEDLKKVNLPPRMQYYAINAFGATFGCLLAGLYFLPKFGPKITSVIFSSPHFIGGLIILTVAYFWRGTTKISTSTNDIKDSRKTLAISDLVIAFFSGFIFIAFEILLYRVAKANFGGYSWLFPFTLSICILAIALSGWLTGFFKFFSVKRSSLIAASILIFTYLGFNQISSLTQILFSTINALSSPLRSIQLTHLLIMSFIGLPPILFISMIFPSLIRDADKDHIGSIFAFNALGCLASGALVTFVLLPTLGYGNLIKMLIFILVLLPFFKERLTQSLKNKFGKIEIIFCIAVLVLTIFLPRWNPVPFIKGLSLLPLKTTQDKKNIGENQLLPEEKIDFIMDDSSSSIGVLSIKYPGKFVLINQTVHLSAKSLIIDGKSDGNTFSDFATTSLLANLGYIHAKTDSNSQALVIGLGTGITPGLLASTTDLKKVTVAEISSGVIKALPLFSEFNFSLDKNTKAKILNIDALRFLVHSKEKFDLIISEPSNPWVDGMENLFAEEFFKLVAQHISDSGIFVQWIHSYKMSSLSIFTVLNNLQRNFKHIRLLIPQAGDVIVLASQENLYNSSIDKFNESNIQMARHWLGWNQIEDINFIEPYPERAWLWAIKKNSTPPHKWTHPTLNQLSVQDRVLGKGINIESLIPRPMGRIFFSDTEVLSRSELLKNYFALGKEKIPMCQPQTMGPTYFCEKSFILMKVLGIMLKTTNWQNIGEQIEAYNILRTEGFWPSDPERLTNWVNWLVTEGLNFPKESMEMMLEKVFEQIAWDKQDKLIINYLKDPRISGLLMQKMGTKANLIFDQIQKIEVEIY